MFNKLTLLPVLSSCGGVCQTGRMNSHTVLSKNSADLDFESTSSSRIDLRGGTMVEAQHPAESLSAFDCAEGRCRAIIGLDCR